MNKKIFCIIGTRPEAIKMAPVIIRLKKESKYDVKVVVTGQHKQMLDQVLDYFQIKPDFDLAIMLPNQSLATLTSRLILELNSVFAVEKPDLVLAQGDTTTVMVASLVSFYLKIPFGHIEAGLRTSNIHSPFPEEMNRVITARIAKFHFSPTPASERNLLNEGINQGDIFMTGNTVIDALHMITNGEIKMDSNPISKSQMILVTVHRRENFGDPLKNICKAINIILEKNSNVVFLIPVHLNPNVYKIIHEAFNSNHRVRLCSPLGYFEFISAMQSSYFILTDSGGVQEEAPALGKPVLVLRDETERPEAIESGAVKLIGTKVESIVTEVQHLLNDSTYYNSMAKGVSPYGDGHASERILKVISEYFEMSQAA
jgi:UDP-N-acetylglucosamine 2-epimerase (non-hydrolysing)